MPRSFGFMDAYAASTCKRIETGRIPSSDVTTGLSDLHTRLMILLSQSRIGLFGGIVRRSCRGEIVEALASDVGHRMLHVWVILENGGEMVGRQRVDVAEGLGSDTGHPSPLAHKTDFCHNERIERQ